MIDWRHWHNEPYLVGGLVFLGWLWAVLAGPLRMRLVQRTEGPTREGVAGVPFPRAQAAMFYASLVIFYLAVGSPLDQMGERFLLSAHMVQHQLIIYPAAVLFLLGLPAWLVRPVTARPGLRRLLRVLTNPVVCGLVYVVTLSVWHAPALYVWALDNRVVHIAEHVTFFGAALFYWWPLVSPSAEFPPLPIGAQFLYLLAVIIGSIPVFGYLALFSNVAYSTYEFAPRLFANFTPRADQLLAASLMELVGTAVVFIVSAAAFFRWDRDGEKRG